MCCCYTAPLCFEERLARLESVTDDHDRVSFLFLSWPGVPHDMARRGGVKRFVKMALVRTNWRRGEKGENDMHVDMNGGLGWVGILSL